MLVGPLTFLANLPEGIIWHIGWDASLEDVSKLPENSVY
jgi:hypothetical protein